MARQRETEKLKNINVIWNGNVYNRINQQDLHFADIVKLFAFFVSSSFKKINKKDTLRRCQILIFQPVFRTLLKLRNCHPSVSESATIWIWEIQKQNMYKFKHQSHISNPRMMPACLHNVLEVKWDCFVKDCITHLKIHFTRQTLL